MSDKPDKKDAAPADKAKGDKGDKHGKDEKGKEGGEKAGKAGMLAKMPALLGIAMVLEAAVLFAGFKFLGGSPKSAGAEVAAATDAHGEGGDAHGEAKTDAHGDEHGDAKADVHGAEGRPVGKVDKKKRIELLVVDFRAPNKQAGLIFLYDVTIVAQIHADAE